MQPKLIVSLTIAISLSLVVPITYGQGISGFFSPLRARFRQPQPFAYPRRVLGDTVYVLNGKQAPNATYVRHILSSEGLLIDTVAVGMLTRQGEQKTIINYKKRP